MSSALPQPEVAGPAEAPPVLVRMSGITKQFGSVTVLRDIHLDIRAGEVLVLAGENGAGKSTLIKILGGVHTEFEGTITMRGQAVRPRSPSEANALGVALIYQELSLIPSMCVADNLFLGRAVTRGGFVDDRHQQQEAQRLLDQLGIEIDVSRRVEDLAIAQQQLIEIAKALAHNAKVFVMDEPTSCLNAPEVENLFGLIAQLKSRGCGIVYITHRMEEIERVADRITVLRDGQCVGTAPAGELSPTKLVQWMVGCDVEQQFPQRAIRLGEERLKLEDYSVSDTARGGWRIVDGVSLSVRAGEILGLAGLQDSGASALFLSLFGALGKPAGGQAWLNGEPLEIANPRRAIEQGVALLTNDRRATGLVLPMSIVANATLANLPRISPGGWRHPAREREMAQELGDTLSLRTGSLDVEVGALSGGNQQKVALAKSLHTCPQLLLLDEPTRGIDIGAKREFYQLLGNLVSGGIAVLLITSELPELLALSDRVLVLHRGRATAEFSREEASATRVLQAAMGNAAP